jgi:hypothetical protein
MDNTETKLALERITESARVSAGGLGTDKNFSVLKGDHVGWPHFIHESLMQGRNAAIGNNQHRNFGRLLEIGFLSAPQTKTKPQSFRRELLKIDNIGWDLPLKISDCNTNVRLHRA